MPYIKRIEIDGFKTFGLKTTLTFDKGFTAITGPNGSGKTNIIDAVLFCLGELSAKRLRAESFANLIFNGGEKSSIKKSEAKVIIQFDNSDGRLPVETSTVTISREIDRNGESVYRINGRKVPRAHLLEALSVAGISPYGHNIVLQGTLTRMAEISTLERRKIIEDMLGIAQYDAEKSEAEAKLKEADIAIKTALGQISEVQKRVEDLERERNNLLRHNFIRREIARLESIKISREIRKLESEVNKILNEKIGVEEKIKLLLERRENTRLKRRDMESELRKLGFDEIERKQSCMIEVQVNIRNLKSKLNEILLKINEEKSEIKRLSEVKEKLLQQSETINGEINTSEEKIRQLTAVLNELKDEIAKKQALYDAISGEISKVRSIFGEKAKRASELEEQLNQIHREKMKLESEYAKIQSRIGVYSQRLEDLKAKKADLKAHYEKLLESLAKLEGIVNEQSEQMRGLQATLEKRLRQRALLEKEIKEAERVAEMAKGALIEFEAQKKLVKRIRSEENALKSIEELAALGVINGVHGRLRNLIKIEKGYEKAVEAAASGWLDSLVVEDMNVAFTCIETLKKMKLGRIKIIPLNGLLVNNNKIREANIEGLSGKISSFVKCDKQYETAVNFVLGDTLLALSEDAAIKASKEGFRVTTLNGDLYEAGGGVESGFYRTPIDISSFVPSDEALKSLDKAVNALNKYLGNRENIISEIEGEIAKVQSDIAKFSESLGKLAGEVERVRKSASQAEIQIKHVEDNILDLSRRIEEDKTLLASFETKLAEMNERENILRSELEHVRSEINFLRIQDVEKQRESIAHELISLKQKYNSAEAEVLTIRSRIEDVLKRNLGNLAAQINDISSRIESLESEIKNALKEESETRSKIEELNKMESEISRELIDAKEKVKEFTSRIDSLDNELMNIDREYENEMKIFNELNLKMQSLNLQISELKERLKNIKEPDSTLHHDEYYADKDVDSQLKIMEIELERIGAINQLAETQYAEQISKYKELSVRLNELEREKMAILKFIEEIEQKKIKVFMEAFNKINERITTYFSKLTGGGKASLKLENPENPFAGGVDMIVQFPGKPPILVSGASSGERSVSAVAFLFALQEFSPASFYLFDEIDAHLDAFHVEKLGELLAEESSKLNLQFIVITLKAEMISKADKIYGVYGRNGISYVISTAFKGAA